MAKPVTITLTDKQEELLQMYCKKHGLKRSRLLQKIIEDWIVRFVKEEGLA